MQEYLVFATMAFALSAYLSVEYYSVRTVVLDTANHHYSVYRGSMLTTTQHCHNIYIRLLCNRSGMQPQAEHQLLEDSANGIPSRFSLCAETRDELAARTCSQLNLIPFLLFQSVQAPNIPSSTGRLWIRAPSQISRRDNSQKGWCS